MIITCKKDINSKQLTLIFNELDKNNLSYSINNDLGYKIILVNNTRPFDDSILKANRGIASITDQISNHPLVDLVDNNYTVIDVNGIKIGGDNVVIMAGPCAIEDYDTLNDICFNIKKSGAHILRGGAYKPRTSPYTFQGNKEKGLTIMNDVGKKHQLPIISELTNINDLELFIKNVDIIQIGTRNMQNFALLEAVGKCNKPVLLKRGMGNTIEELLSAAEYIMKNGNHQVMLCERGIRTFEDSTRTTLDISAISVLKKKTHLPIIVDPSHAAGKSEYVESLALAALAAGADGLIIETHVSPETSVSDGRQSISCDELNSIINKGRTICSVYNKKI